MGNVIFRPLKGFRQKFHTYINDNDMKHYEYEKKI